MSAAMGKQAMAIEPVVGISGRNLESFYMRFLVAVISSLLALPGIGSADAQRCRVVGNIQQVDPFTQWVTISDGGTPVNLRIDPDTEMKSGTQALSLADLRPGDAIRAIHWDDTGHVDVLERIDAVADTSFLHQ